MLVYYRKDGVYHFVSYLKKDEFYDTSLNLRSSKSLEVKQIAFAIDMVEADGYEAHVTTYAEFERVHKGGRMWMIERKTENGYDYLMPLEVPTFTTDFMVAYCSLSEEMAKTDLKHLKASTNENLRVIEVWTDFVNPKLIAEFIITADNGSGKTMFLAQRPNLKKGVVWADCSMKAYRMPLDEAIVQAGKLYDAHLCTDFTISKAPKENIRCEDFEGWWMEHRFDCLHSSFVTLNELAKK